MLAVRRAGEGGEAVIFGIVVALVVFFWVLPWIGVGLLWILVRLIESQIDGVS